MQSLRAPPPSPPGLGARAGRGWGIPRPARDQPTARKYAQLNARQHKRSTSGDKQPRPSVSSGPVSNAGNSADTSFAVSIRWARTFLTFIATKHRLWWRWMGRCTQVIASTRMRFATHGWMRGVLRSCGSARWMSSETWITYCRPFCGSSKIGSVKSESLGAEERTPSVPTCRDTSPVGDGGGKNPLRLADSAPPPSATGEEKGTDDAV